MDKKHKTFRNGKYQYFPIIEAEIDYVNAPRKILIIMDNMDYSEITWDGIFQDAKSQITLAYPDCEVLSISCLSDYEWLENLENEWAKSNEEYDKENLGERLDKVLEKIYYNDSPEKELTQEEVIEFIQKEYDDNGLETLFSRDYFIQTRLEEWNKNKLDKE